MGWLYTRLVASNSYSPEPVLQQEPGEETALLVKHDHDIKMKESIYEFMAMCASHCLKWAIVNEQLWNRELHLQIKLIQLQGLLAQTQHEPRLKGPFPVELYRRVLTSLQTILDRMHSMRCVTTKEEWWGSLSLCCWTSILSYHRHKVSGNILRDILTSSRFQECQAWFYCTGEQGTPRDGWKYYPEFHTIGIRLPPQGTSTSLSSTSRKSARTSRKYTSCEGAITFWVFFCRLRPYEILRLWEIVK